MTTKTTKTIVFAAMMITAIASFFGMSQVFAVSSTGPWTIHQADNTGGTCNSNLTDNNEYACAFAYDSGDMVLLAKVKGAGQGITEDAFTRMNANKAPTPDVIGSSPELVTSASTITFKSVYHLVGTIQETTNQSALLQYGHEVFKKNWLGNWDTVDTGNNCHRALVNNGSYDSTYTVTCTVSNSGTNTYRIGGYVWIAAQNNEWFGDPPAVYADFYTGSNRAELVSLEIY